MSVGGPLEIKHQEKVCEGFMYSLLHVATLERSLPAPTTLQPTNHPSIHPLYTFPPHPSSTIPLYPTILPTLPTFYSTIPLCFFHLLIPHYITLCHLPHTPSTFILLLIPSLILHKSSPITFRHYLLPSIAIQLAYIITYRLLLPSTRHLPSTLLNNTAFLPSLSLSISLSLYLSTTTTTTTTTHLICRLLLSNPSFSCFIHHPFSHANRTLYSNYITLSSSSRHPLLYSLSHSAI